MTNMGKYWQQEDRNRRNLLNHGLAVCKMTLLIKDHKSWTINETPPNRSVMAGNTGGNANMSEYLSILLEPIASDNTCMEVNSTDVMLAEIVKMNEENSNLQEEPYAESIPAVEEIFITTNQGGENMAGLQPLAKAGVGKNCQATPTPMYNQNENNPDGWKDHKDHHQEELAFYIQEDNKEKKTLHIDHDRYSNPKEDLSKQK